MLTQTNPHNTIPSCPVHVVAHVEDSREGKRAVRRRGSGSELHRKSDMFYLKPFSDMGYGTIQASSVW